MCRDAMVARSVCIIGILISVLQVGSCTLTLQVLRSNDIARLRCLDGQIPLESNPTFTISFQADGTMDTFSPNFRLDEYRMTVTPETEIIAHCSHEGETSERVAIAALQAENTTLIDPFDVTINQTAMLNCPLTLGILSNTGILEPYEINWFNNNTNGLVDSDGSNLELPITIESDSLRYWCELRVRLCNGSGCVVVTRRGPTFVLRVLGFEMLETPESVIVSIIDSATFSCGARGRGAIEIDWTYDGRSINVTSFEDSNVVRTVSSTITIPSSDITENEYIVQCNVTQRINGRLLWISHIATLTCNCQEFIITAIPRPQTVAISSNQEMQEHAVFTCTALGISPPILTWNHNQNTASNGSKYQITSTEPRRVEDDGRYNVICKLTITSFNADDSGFVTCRVENSQESASTTIAVLGKPDESDVEITTDGNVTLVIRFPRDIPAIMKLEVTFTDTEKSNQLNSTISGSEYTNTNLIRHDVESSDVPQRFTVSARVVVETENGLIFGPEINFGGIEFTKIIDIIASDNGMSTIIISTSVVFSTLAVITIVILFIFISACLVHKRMQKDLNSQDTNTEKSGNDYVDAFELNLMESRQQSVAIECTDNPTTTEYNNCREGVSASVHADSLASLEFNNTPVHNASVQTIGDLVIFTKQMLGSGAFGCVFKGKLKQQDCAVKVLNPLGMQFVSSLPSTSVIQQEALERFTKECEFLQSLDHGNIVHHIDTRIHPESNLPLLVIELLDCTLKQYLYNCSEDLLPDHTQLSLSCDIASAMKFLHEHNIVHRDLCGDNILIKLSENNSIPIAKVADFGMSRIIDCSTITHTLTALGHRMGYLPPEASLISQTHYDSGLDVFMFGVVMIQIVTKTPHVKSVEERLELIDQIADAHPLKDIILKCLHEESDKRPRMAETSRSLSSLYNKQRN